MHVNEVALYITEHPDFELAAVADVPSDCEPISPYRYTPGWNMSNVRDNYCSNVYENYTEMLDAVKAEFPYITNAQVQIDKLNPPLGGQVYASRVTMNL